VSTAITTAEPVLRLEGLTKHFTLHNQNGSRLRVFEHVNFSVYAGECVVLDGASGTGKSTLLKLIYANYRATAGSIRLFPGSPAELELTSAPARRLIGARRESIGYVSQFLRAIPRVPALDVVAEPLLEMTADDAISPPELTLGQVDHAQHSARAEAARWLRRLGIEERLWALPPATFSGGEQQRINIARSLIKPRAVLLLDEPTASLDAANTSIVIEIIAEARARGAAIIGTFHDPTVAAAVATRRIPLNRFRVPA
jgi:alpha-D-ribose 1-methylphosphonate 5-triphosphate synthase subunit PhnL